MSELIPISALVGDRTYRIRIEPGDEEIVRRTLKSINDKIIEFKVQFAGKDMQDYIAMVLIWFATEISSGNHKVEAADSIADQLNIIEKLLDAQ